MNFAILALALFCIGLLQLKYGYFSFVSAGVFGFLVYSLPAIVGLKRSFYSGGHNYLVPVDDASTAVVLVAWTFFALTLAFARGPSKGLANVPHTRRESYIPKMWIAFALSMAGLAYLAALGGIFFFLESRDLQVEDYVVLIWRWVVVLGFAAAVVERHRWGQILFLSIILIIFLRGDRTIPAICGATYLVLYFNNEESRNRLYRILTSWKLIAATSLVVFVVLFGKSIYRSIKSGSSNELNQALDVDLAGIAYSAEPFATFDHIPSVIDFSLHIPFFEFLTSILGNLLIIPSIFGVETNLYSVTITSTLPYNLGYGIAGNYWAHAMSVWGYPMVGIFAALYAAALTLFDRTMFDRKGAARLTVVAIGSVIAVYTHRNGLDNLLSFVRQIIIASIMIHLIYAIFFRKRRRPAGMPHRTAA